MIFFYGKIFFDEFDCVMGVDYDYVCRVMWLKYSNIVEVDGSCEGIFVEEVESVNVLFVEFVMEENDILCGVVVDDFGVLVFGVVFVEFEVWLVKGDDVLL